MVDLYWLSNLPCLKQFYVDFCFSWSLVERFIKIVHKAYLQGYFGEIMQLVIELVLILTVLFITNNLHRLLRLQIEKGQFPSSNCSSNGENSGKSIITVLASKCPDDIRIYFGSISGELMNRSSY
jgi:hypothetical protein